MTMGLVAPIVLTWVLANAGPHDVFMAGAATTDITPPIGYPMWGYARRHDRPCVGVLDRLYARALVLGCGTERLAIVSLDLGRPPVRQSTEAIRARTRSEANINHLCLVASHTHHGPVIETDNWPSRERPYVKDLEQRVAEAIIQAAKAMQPAKIGAASCEVAMNHNRQSKRADAPVDRQLLVVRVESMDGRAIATAVNFAAHATLHDERDFRFSADYPGALAKFIEEKTKAPCLFLQGAAGDLSADPGTLRGAEAFGRALAGKAFELAQQLKCGSPSDPRLTVAEDDFRFSGRLDFANPVVQMLFAAAFYPDIVSFYVREYRDGIRPHLTTALINQTTGVVGVSGEFFCGHALSLRRRARLDHVLFLGYCNDYQQYFPTIEAAAEGGYGAEPQVSPVEIGAGERIMNRALERLYQMQGKFSDWSTKTK